MRHTPRYLLTDEAEIARLIDAHPWATLVSSTAAGLVASHYPVLRDRASAELTLFSHVGRPDDVAHELGRHEMLVIVQGPHDYVSPTWYGTGEAVPTWNHVTAHLYGVPEVLTDEENFAALTALTDAFEHGRPGARSLLDDEESARRLARGTVGLRMRVTRVDARAKLSQNRAPDVRGRIADELAESNPALADEMRRQL